MVEHDMTGVDFIACNTDAQALQINKSKKKVQLGLTGLGAGAQPVVGRKSAEESLDDVIDAIGDTHMVFIAAGMGGGTGTGAAPVIAKAVREKGILTVAIVTTPFHFEGNPRMKQAEDGLTELEKMVDTLVVIPNQRLIMMDKKATLTDAFKKVDHVLYEGVRSVTDLLNTPGDINLDFADLLTVMRRDGGRRALMVTGTAEGEDRAKQAVNEALNNPLLQDTSIKGATGVLINIYAGKDFVLSDADEVCRIVRENVDPEVNVIFGVTTQEAYNGTLRVVLVITGIHPMPLNTTKKDQIPQDGFLSKIKKDWW